MSFAEKFTQGALCYTNPHICGVDQDSRYLDCESAQVVLFLACPCFENDVLYPNSSQLFYIRMRF